MKRILLIVLLFSFINVWANSKEVVTLNRCVDGDTAIFNIKEVPTRVRFLAIDTPESVKPNTLVQAYGKNASEYTCHILKKAKKIILEYDDKSDKKDKFDRVLAWVWADDLLLEEELIKVGYAKVAYVYKNYSYVNKLYQVQEEAKEKKIGIWSDYMPIYYKVIFKDEDIIKEVLVEENKKVELFTPQKEGYNFIGWYDENNENFDFDSLINKNIILTARYEKDINILEIMLIILSLLTVYYGFRKVNNHGRKYKIK